MKPNLVALSLAAALMVPVAGAQSAATQNNAEELQLLLQQLEQLKQRVMELEQRVADEKIAAREEQPETSEPAIAPRRKVRSSALAARVERLEEDVQEAKNDPIRIGGAVRTQFAWEDYNDGQKNRGGDFDFDLVRIDFSGEMGDVIVSAQYRWFQYMDAVQHAWVGYNFTENWQGQLGVTKVPFGNTPYNSNSYFFSSNFYVGLEDDHDIGAKMRYRDDDWDLDIAFFKQDELGGADGLATNKSDRYAYDAVGVRLVGEGLYDDPLSLAAESNSWAIRGVRKWTFDEISSAEFGASLQFGDMNDGVDDVGKRNAWAVHGVYNFDRWTFMGQVTQYDYDMDFTNQGIIVGAYNYFDTIPSKATLYTANIAYSLPVKIGPITNVTFYNDFSVMTDKRLYAEDTLMNVLGFAISAGGLYTYFDLVTARNQPFVGGSMSGSDKDTNTRFNVNIGYYF